MKRKATNTPGTESPVKISKESIDGADSHDISVSVSSETTKDNESTLASNRLSSARQRKAPAWLSSYVTDGSTTVKETSKPTKSSVPTSTASVKKKGPSSIEHTVKEENDGQTKTEEVPPSLRKESTLKVEDSPPRPNKKKKPPNAAAHSPSLVRKETKILSPSTSDSCDSSADFKQENEVTSMKSLVPNRLQKFPVSKSSSTYPSQTVSKLKTFKLAPKQHITSNIHECDMDAEDLNISNVMEVCDTKSLTDPNNANVVLGEASTAEDGVSSVKEPEKQEVLLEKPKMLEIVICISTSGAMRDYLTVLQEKTRDLVWRLQSLIPDLRIGVLAHTQGGIHDDKPGSGSSAIDHNYIRTGGHSGTKWLDLGATFSQICAFVDSLEPEATIYPDYVQDNLEMALWKLQRCMSWSTCSYRTVVIIGRGRPNRTSFYLQREHWRGWIRSALEIGHKAEIPVIDWELEAKLLAQMGIHVFTIQASSTKTLMEEDEDEGSVFFRRVAEITNGLHIRLSEASRLVDIIVGVCCACHGPDLLQTHRETVRDENDGVLPAQLKEIFVSLQLHSKRRSLSTIPSLVGDLSILKSQLAKADANGNISSSEEEEDDGVQTIVVDRKDTNDNCSVLESVYNIGTKTLTKSKNAKTGKKSLGGNKPKVVKKKNTVPLKSAGKIKIAKSPSVKSGNVAKKAVKIAKKAVKVLKTIKVGPKNVKKVTTSKTKTNKSVVKSEKNVTNSNAKKQRLKEKKVKEVKAAAKQVQTKSKKLKTETKTSLKKNTKIKAKPVAVTSRKKNKKVESLNSNGSIKSSKSESIAECILPS